jgi:hypothetical protein
MGQYWFLEALVDGRVESISCFGLKYVEWMSKPMENMGIFGLAMCFLMTDRSSTGCGDGDPDWETLGPKARAYLEPIIGRWHDAELVAFIGDYSENPMRNADDMRDPDITSQVLLAVAAANGNPETFDLIQTRIAIFRSQCTAILPQLQECRAEHEHMRRLQEERWRRIEQERNERTASTGSVAPPSSGSCKSFGRSMSTCVGRRRREHRTHWRTDPHPRQRQSCTPPAAKQWRCPRIEQLQEQLRRLEASEPSPRRGRAATSAAAMAGRGHGFEGGGSSRSVSRKKNRGRKQAANPAAAQRGA